MKKIYTLPFIIGFILIWIHCPSLAQIPEAPTTSLSPNAASLGLYGSIPVSHYTGVPNIEIPLYELDCHGFKLPLSLRYHASGVRPDQHPGWVGLGWSLNAGGVITRKINDLQDDLNLDPKHYPFSENAGYYFNHNILNTNLWNDVKHLKKNAESDESKFKDTEPDEFSFNFLDYSGKFYLTHTGEWAVQCNKPVKVEFNGIFSEVPFKTPGTVSSFIGLSPYFNGFTIIGEDGTKYLFGGEEGNTNHIEYSIGFLSQSQDIWNATSWYLTKIVLANKQEITFKYERGSFINQMYIAVHNDLGSATESSSGIFDVVKTCTSSSINGVDLCYQGQMIAPTYLSEIEENGNTITFFKTESIELPYFRAKYELSWRSDYAYYDKGVYCFSLLGDQKDDTPYLPILMGLNCTGYPDCLKELKRYKLDKIMIKDNSKKDIKTIDFGYANSPFQRLRLLNITESGKNPYHFGYYQPEKLPGYLSNKTDHWGFYNNNFAPVGGGDDYYIHYYSYREPNPAYLNIGTINKITYPTGGYTEFEFEPHQYSKQVKYKRWEDWEDLGSNKYAGGLRVRKISDFTAEGVKASSKEYFYVTDYPAKTNAGRSSGVLGGQIQYYFKDYIVPAYNKDKIRRSINIFSSISVLPSSQNANGCHVGYSEVIEKREDGAFSRYLFTNFDNGHLDEQADAIIQESHSPYEPYASKEQERGNMIAKQDFNADYYMVKKKTIEYEKDNASTSNYVRAMKASYTNVCNDTAVSYSEGTSYRYYTYSMRPKSETETYYISNAPSQSITTNYIYNGQKLIQSQTTTNSDGATYTTSYKYPSEYSSSPYREMSVANILSPVVMKSVSRNGVPLSEESSDYALLYSRFYKPVNKKLKQDNTTAAEIRETYMYDEKGNVREIRKDFGETTVYLWGCDYQYPIAEIKGATYDEVVAAISGGEASIISLALSVNTDMTKVENLRNAPSLSKALITTYKFKPLLGMEYMINEFGVKTEYKYDSNGKLTEIKYDGQTINTYKYNYRP